GDRVAVDQEADGGTGGGEVGAGGAGRGAAAGEGVRGLHVPGVAAGVEEVVVLVPPLRVDGPTGLEAAAADADLSEGGDRGLGGEGDGLTSGDGGGVEVQVDHLALLL